MAGTDKQRKDEADDGDEKSQTSYYDLPFVVVLHDMLLKESKPGPENPVRWIHNGEAFVINEKLPPPNSLGKILSKYFKHDKYTSIQRQLNLYGFSKHQDGKYKGAFHHPMFHRDKPQNIEKIKRRAPGKSRKLGTRKRKAQRRHSDVSESSTLIREAALVDTGNTKETYYYGSDLSTTNDNSSLLGYDDNTDTDNMMETEDPESEVVLDDMEEATDGGDYRYLDMAGDQDDDDELEDELTMDPAEPPKKQATSNKIVLPFSLKQVMLKTWEHISQRKLIPTVPANLSIKTILDMYVEAKLRQITPPNPQDARLFQQDERIQKRLSGWKDLMMGLNLFFDKALESRLLYPQELPQYKALMSQPEYSSKSPTELYSCEHLLRLLLRLPDILAECVVEEKRRPILDDMKDFVRFLHQHQDSFLSTTYHSFTKAELREHKHLMANLVGQ